MSLIETKIASAAEPLSPQELEGGTGGAGKLEWAVGGGAGNKSWEAEGQLEGLALGSCWGTGRRV